MPNESGGHSRPRNQGPDGPNAEKPLKIDLPFEEAVKRAMRAGKPTINLPRGTGGRRAGRAGQRD